MIRARKLSSPSSVQPRQWSLYDPVVYLLEDDRQHLNKMESAFEKTPFPTRVYETGGLFLKSYRAAHQGCLVSAMNLPDMDGIELQRQLLSKKISLPVIFMADQNNVQEAVDVMKLGAFDCLRKPVDMDRLLKRVSRAIRLTQSNGTSRRNLVGNKKRLSRLSPREQEILLSIMSGQSNKQIAFELGLSIRTVANHRLRVIQKTEARNTADLVRMATIVLYNCSDEIRYSFGNGLS